MNLPAAADPVGTLRKAGLLRFDGHPMDELLAQVSAAVNTTRSPYCASGCSSAQRTHPVTARV
ncbi:hypothetical protein ABZ942_29430 [Nocardia sp. NPDC046473]|uniref:hypothetical protein n=1 Tax=Nocardia sp. NPDC046473 TaxID=3155733 RepID=UPI0033E6CBF8